MKKALLLVLKLVIIGGLIAFAATRFDSRAAAGVLRSVDTFFGVLAFLLGMTTVFVTGLRWKRILKGIWPAHRFSVWRLFYYNNLAIFYSLFIPTSIAGETVRAIKLSAEVEQEKARAVQAVLIDRLLGAATWFLIFLVVPLPIGRGKYWLLLPLVLGALVFVRKKITLFGHELLDFSRHHPADVAWGVFYSFASQFVAIASTYAALHCFGIGLSPLQAAGLAAIGALAGIVPLSLFGISMREGSYLGLLPLYGVSSTQAIMVITFFVCTNYLFGLMGGMLELGRTGWSFSRLRLEPEQKGREV